MQHIEIAGILRIFQTLDNTAGSVKLRAFFGLKCPTFPAVLKTPFE